MNEQKRHKTYRGWRDEDGNPHVTVDTRSLRCVGYHSEEFAWGYTGSGPAELALAILANHFGERPRRDSSRLFRGDYRCWAYHQAFKDRVVTAFGDRWELTGNQIDAWLEQQPQRWADPAVSPEQDRDSYGRTVISFQDLF